ncbi:hypothetical protein [Vibrio rotiferianus]|uniref:hypothetical protein n=1 Tax=Vibrio rotiferianus TaxID=190895 RepID=UPI0005EEFDC0|nr:hypothetical protein [Vibrio rotiferianus]
MNELDPMEIHYVGNYVLNKALGNQHNCDKHRIAIDSTTRLKSLAFYQQLVKERISQLHNLGLHMYTFNLINCDNKSRVVIAGNQVEFMVASNSAIIFGQFNDKTWEQAIDNIRSLMVYGVHKGMVYDKNRISEEEADALLAPTKPYILSAIFEEVGLIPEGRDATIVELYDPAQRTHPFYNDIMFAIYSLSRHQIDGKQTNWKQRKLTEHRFTNFDYQGIEKLPFEKIDPT